MTTTTDITGKEQVLVAVDISKHFHQLLIEFPGGNRKKYKITNSLEGFEYLKSVLSPFKKVVLGFETTGNYHRNLAYFSISQGYDTKCVSVITLARTREALHNSWDKNDPKDAQVILYLLKQGLTQIYYDPNYSGINDWQELAKTHKQLSLRKTKIQHSIINHYLAIYFPEIEKFWIKNKSTWFLDLLAHFPTPQAITQLSEEQFVEMGKPLLLHRPFKESLLRDIYKAAAESVGVPITDESQAVKMFKITISQYRTMLISMNEIEKTAHELLSENHDYKVLRSLPGIGPILALTIIAEAGDLRRFGHVNQFLKFCGFDLSTIRSGTHKGNSRLSKRGNAKLRGVFWLAAKTAVNMKGNTFKEKFKRYIAADPENKDLRRKAYTATAAKVARVAYSLVNKNEYYRPMHIESAPDGRT